VLVGCGLLVGGGALVVVLVVPTASCRANSDEIRYAPRGKYLGNSWRIGPDDTTWAAMLKNIDINADLYAYAGPGGW